MTDTLPTFRLRWMFPHVTESLVSLGSGGRREKSFQWPPREFLLNVCVIIWAMTGVLTTSRYCSGPCYDWTGTVRAPSFTGPVSGVLHLLSAYCGQDWENVQPDVITAALLGARGRRRVILEHGKSWTEEGTE